MFQIRRLHNHHQTTTILQKNGFSLLHVSSPSTEASLRHASSLSSSQQQKSGGGAGTLSTLKFQIDTEAAHAAFEKSVERSQKIMQLLDETTRESLDTKLSPETMNELYCSSGSLLATTSTSVVNPVLELGKEKELPQIRKAAIAVCKKLVQGKKLPDSVAPAAFTVLCADAQWIKYVAEEAEKIEQLNENKLKIDQVPVRENFYESFKHLIMNFIISSLVLDSDRVCVSRAAQAVAALLCLLEQIELLYPTSIVAKEAAATTTTPRKLEIHAAVRSRTEISLEQCFEHLWGHEFERLAVAVTAKDDRKRQLIAASSGTVIPLPAQSHIFNYVFGRTWERSMYRLLEVKMRFGAMRSLHKFTNVFFGSRFHLSCVLWAERLVKEVSAKKTLSAKKELVQTSEAKREELLKRLDDLLAETSAGGSVVSVEQNLQRSTLEQKVKTLEESLEKLYRDVALLEKDVEKSVFLIEENTSSPEIPEITSMGIALAKMSSRILIKSHPLLSTSAQKKLGEINAEVSESEIKAENKNNDDKNVDSSSSKEDQQQLPSGVLQKPLQLPKQFAAGWGVVVKHTLLRQLRTEFSSSPSLMTTDEKETENDTTSISNLSEQQIVDKLVNFVQPLLNSTERLEFAPAVPASEQAVKEAVVKLFKKYPKIHVQVAQLKKESNLELKKSILIRKLKKGSGNAIEKNNEEETTAASKTSVEDNDDADDDVSVTPLFKTRAEHLLTEYARESLLARLSRCNSMETFSAIVNELPLLKSDGPLFNTVCSASEQVSKTLRVPDEVEDHQNTSDNNNTKWLLTNDAPQSVAFTHVQTWLRVAEFETRFSAWRSQVAVDEILYQKLLGSTSATSTSVLQNVPGEFMVRPQLPSLTSSSSSTASSSGAGESKSLSFSLLRTARAVTLCDPVFLAGHKAKDAQAKEFHARLWLRLAAFGLIEYTTCEVPDPKYFLMMMSSSSSSQEEQQGVAAPPQDSSSTKEGTKNVVFNANAPTIPSVNDMIIEASAAPCLQLMSEMAGHKKLSVKSEMLREAKCAVLCRMLKRCEKLKFPRFLSGEEALHDYYEKEILVHQKSNNNDSNSTNANDESTTITKNTTTNIKKDVTDLLVSSSSSPNQDPTSSSKGAAITNSVVPSGGSPIVSRRRTLDAHYTVAVHAFIPEYKENNNILIDGVGAPSASMWRILANAVSMISTSGCKNNNDDVIRTFTQELGMFKNEEEIFDSMVHTITCCLAQVYLSDSRALREHQLSRILLYIALMSKANDGLAHAFVRNENFSKVYVRTLKACARNRAHHHHQAAQRNQQQQNKQGGGPMATSMRPQLDSDGNDATNVASDRGTLEFQIRSLVALASTSSIITSSESVISPSEKREILDPFRDSISRGTFPPSNWKSDEVASIFIAVCSIPELLAFATSSFFDRVAQRLDEFKECEVQAMYECLKSSSAAMSSLSAALTEGLRQRMNLPPLTAATTENQNRVSGAGDESNSSSSSFASLITQVNLPKHASDAAKIQLIHKINNIESSSSSSSSSLSAVELLHCLRASDKHGPGLVLKNAVRSRILHDLKNRKPGEFPAFVTKMMEQQQQETIGGSGSDEIDQEQLRFGVVVRNQTLVELARTMSTHFFGDAEIWEEWNNWMIKEWISGSENNSSSSVLYHLDRADRQALSAVQYVAGIDV